MSNEPTKQAEPLTYEELWGTPPPDDESHERGHESQAAPQMAHKKEEEQCNTSTD